MATPPTGTVVGPGPVAGGGLLSRIVAVAVPAATVALTGALSTTVKCRVPLDAVPPTICTVTVAVVVRGGMTTAPSAATKSAPAFAVPAIVDHCTCVLV